MTHNFRVEIDGLYEINAALGKMRNKSNVILKAAINNTAKQTEMRMVDEARDTYRYKRGRKGDIREANTIKKATVRNLSSTIEAKGPVNELLSFHVQPSTYYPGGKGAPSWVKARARRDAKLEKIALRPSASGDKYKAFVIRYHSGHFALAQRVPGKRMKANPNKEAVKSLLSVSTPKMEEAGYDREISNEMQERLERNMQAQIEKFLGGR